MNRPTLLFVLGIALTVSASASTVASSPAQTFHTISSVAALPAPANCCGGDPGGGGTWPFAPTKSLQISPMAAVTNPAACCGGDPGGGGTWPFAPAQSLQSLSPIAMLSSPAACCGGDPGGGGTWPFAPTPVVSLNEVR